MAQVYGPLQSQSASGQFAEALIYQRYHGKNYVKAYGKPNWTSHPATAPQLAVQAMNKLLMEAWPAISAADKATWDALAVPARISRVNAYLRENFKRLRSGRLATTVWPAVEVLPAPTVTDVSNHEPYLDALIFLTGTNFTGFTTVMLAGVAAGSPSLLSDTQIECYVPAGPAIGHAVVTTPSGSSEETEANAITLPEV
jgi:hypothetical protein